MSQCIFCKIIAKQLPADILFENESLIAFSDLHPKAPVHILIIPKIHLSSVNDLEKKHQILISSMIITAKTLATKYHIDSSGYRLIFNVKNDGGQEIDHLHLHLIGGKKLGSMA